jgi:hypothetical protein
MIALSPHLVELLGNVAGDVREVFEAEQWSVAAAVELNAAFTDTNHPRASMTRAIIAREFLASAHRNGLSDHPAQGGAVELYEQNGEGMDMAMIRLRGAKDVDGDLRVLANAGSTWGGLSEDGFWREIPYVFAWYLDEAGALQFVVAESVGKTAGSMPCFEFGWMHRFISLAPSSTQGFAPDNTDSLGDWDARHQSDTSAQA